MKSTLLTLALVSAGALAVTVAEAQPAPTAPPPGAPAPTATTDPNAPPPPAPGAPGAPAQPAPTATTTAQPAPPPPGAPGAQPTDPNAPPAPPPVAPPPATTAPAAEPAPPVFAPPPVPVVSWSPTTPASGSDTATPTNKPKPLRWRGTTAGWYQYATSSVFGIRPGLTTSETEPNTQGPEDDEYAWSFSLSPNFFLVDEPKDKVTVSATIGASVELTNCNSCQLKNETLFNDVRLNFKYTRTLLGIPSDSPEFTTKGSFGLGFVFPTSKASSGQGRYLSLSLGPSVSQTVRLLGSKSDLLPNATVGVSFTYSHLFSRATQPTNEGEPTQRLRQNLNGDTVSSDVLGTGMFSIDVLTTGVSLSLPIYKDLSLATAFRHIGRFKPPPPEAEICENVLTGCVKPDSAIEDPATYFVDTYFDIGLGYTFFDSVDLSIGYNNSTGYLGEDGRARNFFFSPASTFYLDITANIDAIYSKATNRDKQTAKSHPSSWF